MKYEYKTVVQGVRCRPLQDGEPNDEYLMAPICELVLVDDPRPPDGEGWELVTTSFPPSKVGIPPFVARDWRREVKPDVPLVSVPGMPSDLALLREAATDFLDATSGAIADLIGNGGWMGVGMEQRWDDTKTRLVSLGIPLRPAPDKNDWKAFHEGTHYERCIGPLRISVTEETNVGWASRAILETFRGSELETWNHAIPGLDDAKREAVRLGRGLIDEYMRELVTIRREQLGNMNEDNSAPNQNRRRVIIESPYAGDPQTVARNEGYVRAAMRDSIRRGEAPFASHALYTQPGVLDDNMPDERKDGMESGFAWGEAAQATVVYQDLGITPGMEAGIERARRAGRPVELRTLPGWNWRP